jgi:hypothetical protein
MLTILNTPVNIISSLPLTQQLFLAAIYVTIQEKFKNNQTFYNLIMKFSINMTPAQKLTGEYLIVLLEEQGSTSITTPVSVPFSTPMSSSSSASRF